MSTPNTVTLSLEDYNELLKFKEAIQQERYIYSYSFYGYSIVRVITKDEAMKEMQESIDTLKDLVKKKKWYQF